jgi:sugar phosphate isomerase/epimerase
MRLGLMSSIMQGRSFEEMLDFVAAEGMTAVEIGTGNYPGAAHCPVDRLLEDAGAARAYLKAVDDRGLIISALSCHGNPLHPRKEIAGAHHEVFRKTVLLAERLGIERICLFSGCPGDSETATYPNWVTSAWPPDFPEVLEWQWREKVIPYWREQAAFATAHGVPMLCFEMHPSFVVYNPETLLRLREAAGEAIGANFDPSHLYWQGIDPVLAIRALGRAGALFHVHAKDTGIDAANAALNGVLDTKSYTRLPERSWIFRSVGWGHDLLHWKGLVSELRVNGYDYVMSIEHEDALASDAEGLRSAVATLKQCLLTEPPAHAFWA